MLKANSKNFWQNCEKCFKSTPTIDKDKLEVWFS